MSLSINTVVIAALALIVLVVLAIIMGKNFSDFNEGTGSCVARGGEANAYDGCVDKGNCQLPDIRVTGTECDKKIGDMVCCVRFNTDEN